MGSQVGNTRLAGDAAARLRNAASESIQMRRAALQNKNSATDNNGSGALNEFKPVSLPASQGEGNPPQPDMRRPPVQSRSEFSEQGSPAYDQMMERIRSSNPMKNAGSNF